jgi:hypothetical protein
MAVSDWVPIASVVATATVGLGVPIVTSRFDRQKIRDQADEVRRDELRQVIDEAGAQLMPALNALLDADVAAARDEDLIGLLDTFSGLVRDGWYHHGRLAVRVGVDADIVESYTRAMMALGDAETLLRHIRLGITSYDDEARAWLSNARFDVLVGQQDFYDEASRRVGLMRDT